MPPGRPRKPKPKPKPRPISPADRWLEYEHLRAACRVSYMLGARPGDLVDEHGAPIECVRYWVAAGRWKVERDANTIAAGAAQAAVERAVAEQVPAMLERAEQAVTVALVADSIQYRARALGRVELLWDRLFANVEALPAPRDVGAAIVAFRHLRAVEQELLDAGAADGPRTEVSIDAGPIDYDAMDPGERRKCYRAALEGP